MSPIQFSFSLLLGVCFSITPVAAATKVTVQIEGIRQSDQSRLAPTTLRFNPDYHRFERAEHVWKN